jgi:hypothetical protein
MGRRAAPYKGMFPVGRRKVKPKRASGPVTKARQALERPAGLAGQETDISASFRRARSSIDQITTDLKRLQRRTTAVVRNATRPAKLK